MDMGFQAVYCLGLSLWPDGTPEPHSTRNGEPDTNGGYARSSGGCDACYLPRQKLGADQLPSGHLRSLGTCRTAGDTNRLPSLRGEGLTMLRALIAAVAVTVCCLGNPGALPTYTTHPQLTR